MGLFSIFGSTSSNSEETKRASEIRTGAVAPSRAERQRCWAARDAYFACLDKAGIVDALKEDGAAAAAKACGQESAEFDKDCAAQWVSPFPPFIYSLVVGGCRGVGRVWEVALRRAALTWY
jgi:cytochrome c oxidase assembly factor 6